MCWSPPLPLDCGECIEAEELEEDDESLSGVVVTTPLGDNIS